MKYTKWAQGEPKQKIACVYLDIAGAWKTASCNESYFSVCRKPDGKSLNLTIVITMIISLALIVVGGLLMHTYMLFFISRAK